MDDIRNREARVRRALAKRGQRLQKTPARSWLRDEYGPGYQILEGNIVVYGCFSREYEATLTEVEDIAFCSTGLIRHL